MNKEEITEKDKNRYEVLLWIYEEYQKNKNRFVHLDNLIGDTLDFQEKRKRENEISDIAFYLSGEGLITTKSDNGMSVYLEHLGIKEIEDSVRNPHKPTDHFPISVIQHFNAPVGSVQTGNQSIANVQQNFGAKTEEVINLLRELREHISDDSKQEGLALIESLEKEIKSEKPSEPTIKLFLKGIGNFVKDTGKDLFVEIGKKLISGEI